MKKVQFLRRWHRRIALVVGIQLLLWTASGLVFTLRPIEEIRGEHLVAISKTADEPSASDYDGLSLLAERDEVDLTRGAQLRFQRKQWVWQVPGDRRAFNATHANPLALMDEAEARETAMSLVTRPGPILTCDLLTEPAAQGEYRGGAVPAWRVSFDEPESVVLYLDANTGELLSQRTRDWRIFDWFWGLHIMDWNEREDFHHPLLIAAAILGLVTSTTGVALAVGVYVLRWRARRAGMQA